MLTRLRVSGFKNLLDVDVSFGPFTCIAGGNAVGKSNLFDAIMLLSAIADRPLIEAAMSVRDEGGRAADIRTLFHSDPKEGYGERIRLEAEMIVATEGHDDLGQYAKASITFLRYAVELAYKPSGIDNLRSGIQLTLESLEHINLGDAWRHLPFPHSMAWRKSVVRGRRTSPFISTVAGVEDNTIRLHQEGSGGRTRSVLAASLPRTVLSTVNAAESPTAVLVRREMQSWRLLQLEPTALRSPDSFTAPTHVSSDGSHIPATLYSLGRRGTNADPANAVDVFARISNRLSELVEDVRTVSVDRDDTRELLTLRVLGKDSTSHPARSLSDGTLRFLALAVLEADPGARGVLCFEEPENGIHPERMKAMVQLLRDLAVDTRADVGSDNPLRQVIINTHSPTVVAEVPEDSLLLAERALVTREDHWVSTVVFRPLSNTWRTKVEGAPNAVQKGRILAFLNPVRPRSSEEDLADRGRRVIEREDIRQLSLWGHIAAGAHG